MEAYAYAIAAPIGFRRLFHYIDGGNEEGIKIPMTSPVVTEIDPSKGPFCKSNFTISFFVPHEFHSSPPRPSDDAVYIDCMPSTVFYVAESGGFKMDDFSVSRMAKELQDHLDEDDARYKNDTFYFAGYDPPFRLKRRHNEVWLQAEDTTDSSEQAIFQA